MLTHDRPPSARARLALRTAGFLPALVLTTLTIAPLIAQSENQPGRSECLWCHGDPSLGERSGEELLSMVRLPPGPRRPRPAAEIPSLVTPEKVLLESAHSNLECVECHRSIHSLPHDQRLPTVDCGECHGEVVAEIAKGPHAVPETLDGKLRPACRDCHGPAHAIRPPQPTRSYDRMLAIVRACTPCHDEAGAVADGEVAGSGSAVHTYRENVHGRALFDKGLPASATCADCHGPHSVLPPGSPESPLSPARAPATCGGCHAGIEEVFLKSVHGSHLQEGRTDAASCTSCHHSHGIDRVDEPFLRSVLAECSDCHLDLGRSYLLSYHGKAASLGGHSAAVCSSCHGAHDILPASDPASRVAPANLESTCGECHEGANDKFVSYISHVDYSSPEKNPVVYYTRLVMLTLLLSVLAVFVPHSLLGLLRSLVDRIRTGHAAHDPRAPDRMIQRFRPIHRFTHFLIVISFMGLVATGFPLKYSNTAWARELTAVFGGVETMGTLHRIFAIITFLYAAIHVGFLVWFFARECPRPRWRFIFGPDSMLFSLRDPVDFFRTVRWSLFLGPKPKFERWTYLEKFDYFGEAWGVFLIGGSGLLLWFPTFFTRWLPGWIMNCAMVIHSIEALLAASVIFLVHFLNTHLRPDRFPVDMVMLTGQMPESEMREERADEYVRLQQAGKLEERVVPPVSVWWRIFGRVTGVLSFLCGLTLIALALLTEVAYRFDIFG